MTKIAILIPTFNSANTISETLKSIERQGDALERITAIYIADDCSQDGTIEVAKATWKREVPLIVLPGVRNMGERANVNRVMAQIQERVDWVFILHSDDIAKDNWLEIMITQLYVWGEKVASICSSWDTLLPDGSIIPGQDEPFRDVEVISGGPNSVRSTLLKGCWWHISGCAIRMEAFKAVGKFAPNMSQLGDWDWLLRCLERRRAIVYVPRTLILYRQHPESVSTHSFQRNRDIHESLQIVYRYAYLLSWNELTRFHARRASWTIRRLGRAMLKGNVEGVPVAVGTMTAILRSYVRCLGLKSR